MWEMAAHLFLADTPFSRNRHYEAFRDARFRPALVLYRRLRALLGELEAASRHAEARVTLVDDERDGARCVRLELVAPRLRRTAWLEPGAWDVLVRHPAARAALEALHHRSPNHRR